MAQSEHDPHFASDCIAPNKLKPSNIKKGKGEWTENSDYSYGGLDDFCLHTQISDESGILKSRERNYRGLGSDFGIIQKLMRGNAWSFQRNGPIGTANMNWNGSLDQYENYEKIAKKYEADAKAYKDNYTMYYHIRDLYNQTGTKYHKETDDEWKNMTKILNKLNETLIGDAGKPGLLRADTPLSYLYVIVRVISIIL